MTLSLYKVTMAVGSVWNLASEHLQSFSCVVGHLFVRPTGWIPVKVKRTVRVSASRSDELGLLPGPED